MITSKYIIRNRITDNVTMWATGDKLASIYELRLRPT